MVKASKTSGIRLKKSLENHSGKVEKKLKQYWSSFALPKATIDVWNYFNQAY